jgi:Cellulose biosynthesis protein BcsN
MRAMRCLFPFALLSSALSGCSLLQHDHHSIYEPTGDTAEAHAPLAELPTAAGEVVAVLQNEIRGVLTQRIVLRGDPGTIGENAIIVKIDNDPRDVLDVDGQVGRPSKSMIARELEENFAGVDMGMSPSFAHNSFGPFGYALGHPHTAVTCMYAWQWGMAKAPKLGDSPEDTPSMPVAKTSVRVRLCRSTLDEAEMVSLLRGLQVFSPKSHVAFLDPDYAGAGDTAGDALAAAGVGYFVGPNSAPRSLEEAPKHARKHAHHKFARREDSDEREARRERRREDRETLRDERADFDPAARRAVSAPMPNAAPAADAAPATNPLLAPLAASAPAPRAAADDVPMPAHASAAAAPAAPTKAAAIPLPN